MEENQQPPVEPTMNQELTKEPKKKKTCPLAIAIILALLAAGSVGFGIYELLTANNQTNCKTAIQNDSETQNDNPESQNNEKSLMTNSNTINLPSSDSPSKDTETEPRNYYTVQNSNPDDIFQYTNETLYWKTNDEEYYIKPTLNGWSIFNNNATEEKIIKTQSSKMKYAAMGGFGVNYEGATLLFINDNDQIESLNLYSAFKNENFETTVVAELKNIIRIHAAGRYHKGVAGGGATTLAEDEDGNFFDLYRYLYE